MAVDKPGDGRGIGRQANGWRLALPRRDIGHGQGRGFSGCAHQVSPSFEAMQHHALQGLARIALYAPFLQLSKADIVSEGARLGVRFEETWSCYQGGALHCGRCGTCVERREAFHLAAQNDPTSYEDPDYWIEACQEYQTTQRQ
ncbi:MAG: hypothetical protein E5Y51_11780 [Mesorhizobium sp.]|nr:MAG: hypothetical protein E5Y51_11780 [Mesorhizobium sp.]